MEGDEAMSAAPDEGWLVAHPPPRRVRLFALPPTSSDYTVEDWLKLPETGERIELIDGSFVVSPIPAYAHALAAKRLVRILDDARPRDYEVVETGNLKVGEDGLIPDIVVGHAEAMIAGITMLSAADTVNLSGRGYELVAEGKAGNVLSFDQPFPVSFDPAVPAGLDR
ncbi:hypothetical protein [Nonomuraea sp. JJY05]|uniref:hypothetical protein n=1 Tax=Nonomuraea sp. JJY05 TaxID=3350255 RepID=UPI00373EE294